MSDQLTRNFSLKELCRSQTADEHRINNLPLDTRILSALHFTAAGMERVRALLLFPIKVLSGYRCLQVNRLVGSNDNSQHPKGEAVDFVCPAYGTPLEVCRALEPLVLVLGIDQLIYEGTWIHCSFTMNPRGEILTKKNGKYLKGLVE